MTRLAAKLRDRLEILKPSQTANSSGSYNRGYEHIRRIWGRVRSIASRQIKYNRSENDFSGYVVTVRPDRDLKKDVYLRKVKRLNPNQILRIVSVNDEVEDMWILTCEEIEQESTENE